MQDPVRRRREVVVVFTDSDPHITLAQGRGVIESVSDHQHVGLALLQVFDIGHLVPRALVEQHSTRISHLLLERRGFRIVIPRQHGQFIGVFQGSKEVKDAIPVKVADRKKADGLLIPADSDDTFLLQPAGDTRKGR